MIMQFSLLLAMLGSDAMVPLDELVKQAEKANRPLLIDFYAVWCGPCKRFDHDSTTDEEIKQALSSFVVAKYDAEKGIGKELADRYKVSKYPTYLIMNHKKQTIDSWAGYSKEDMLKRLQASLADSRPIETKIATFEREPEAELGIKLAEYYSAQGDAEEALSVYQKIQSLANAPDVTFQIFDLKSRQMHRDGLKEPEVERAAQAYLAQPMDDVFKRVYVVQILGDMHEQKSDLYKAELAKLFRQIEDGNMTGAGQAMAEIKPEYLLHVKQDQQAAYEARLAAMAPDWHENADLLNSIAWWCFVNKTMLAEGKAHAEKGISLAEDDTQKAMILDTLAEIEYAQGNTQLALARIQEAVAAEPESEFYKKQLLRFQKAIEDQEGNLDHTNN